MDNRKRRVFARVSTVAAFAAIAVLPASADARFGQGTLSTGSQGHDVRVLQSWLNKLGFRTAVDGEFGRGTRSALRRFEQVRGLPVDGVLTPSDARALRDAMQAKAAGNGGYTFQQQQTAAGDQQGEPGDPAQSGAPDQTGQPGQPSQPTQVGPGSQATIAADGLHAVAPADAPPEVQQAIEAANRIVGKPYRYGGGHGRWEDSGYDCSGTVSYALRGAGMLDRPMASGDLESWGVRGPGQWMTIYANSGHTYAIIAGLRLDTSGSGGKGPRWHEDLRSGSGYVVRHWRGF
jgi:peptidoglycan hydrolase-like protein with peptidoglycan-binding domain